MLALSLAGLPLTGGSLAKLAVKAPLGDGAAASLANLSAAGTALLMLHFLTRLVRIEPRDAPRRLRLSGGGRQSRSARFSFPGFSIPLSAI